MLHLGVECRIAELRLAKSLLLNSASGPIVFSGDFNAALPYERRHMAQTLAPEFAWETQDLGPTLDSRYSENVAHLPNRIAHALSLFNTGVRLRADHIFVDQKTAGSHSIQCSILPDRVSDHSPVEFMIDP